MKMWNAEGQAVYFNVVQKNGKQQFIVKALDGQVIRDRDGQKRSSRTFTQVAQAERFLANHGYTCVDPNPRPRVYR